MTAVVPVTTEICFITMTPYKERSLIRSAGKQYIAGYYILTATVILYSVVKDAKTLTCFHKRKAIQCIVCPFYLNASR